jgi:hypothetical protein
MDILPFYFIDVKILSIKPEEYLLEFSKYDKCLYLKNMELSHLIFECNPHTLFELAENRNIEIKPQNYAEYIIHSYVRFVILRIRTENMDNFADEYLLPLVKTNDIQAIRMIGYVYNKFCRNGICPYEIGYELGDLYCAKQIIYYYDRSNSSNYLKLLEFIYEKDKEFALKMGVYQKILREYEYLNNVTKFLYYAKQNINYDDTTAWVIMFCAERRLYNELTFLDVGNYTLLGYVLKFLNTSMNEVKNIDELELNDYEINILLNTDFNVYIKRYEKKRKKHYNKQYIITKRIIPTNAICTR